MSYAYSEIDKKNIKWFKNDNSRQSLTEIQLITGSIRGLTPFLFSLSYPITVIAGANGSGKSTLLALAACAFHNDLEGFCPEGRKYPYYTFSDFFIQSNGEIGPGGVLIAYKIRHDNWRNSEPGEGSQIRRKSQGGKWNNYESRVRRNVVYFGIQRVVPYFERTTHKSYRARFKPSSMAKGTRERIAKLGGFILGKSYQNFQYLKHGKYSLPKVETKELGYSGFNMGAGESAVFEILSTIFAVGEGGLHLIDEIELGLHERAQVRFIEVLKKLCHELKCQIICTTHSYEILAAIPPEGRLYVETIAARTHFFPGISADYACGQMGRSGMRELDIFVEDDVAHTMVQASLPLDLRARCRILEIGSHGSLKRLMAARYMENRRSCLCILDGDQRNSLSTTKSDISTMCDGKFADQSDAIRDWVEGHVDFLPGDQWPEKWIFEAAYSLCEISYDGFVNSLSRNWQLSHSDQLLDLFQRALSAGKHKEFHTLSVELSLAEELVRENLIMAMRENFSSEFDRLEHRVRGLLTQSETGQRS